MIGQDLIKRFDERFGRLERSQVKYRQGVVASTSPLTVTLGGSSVEVSAVALDSAGALGVGQVVSVLQFGNDLLVAGTIGGYQSGYRHIGNFTNNTTNLQYTNIPQTYQHLRVVWIAQSDRNLAGGNTGGRFTMNGLTGANYSIRYQAEAGAAARARGVASWYAGQIPCLTRTSDDCVGVVTIDFPFYSRTDFRKGCVVHTAGDDGTNALGATADGVYTASTVAITSIELKDDVAGTLGPRSRAELWAA